MFWIKRNPKRRLCWHLAQTLPLSLVPGQGPVLTVSAGSQPSGSLPTMAAACLPQTTGQLGGGGWGYMVMGLAPFPRQACAGQRVWLFSLGWRLSVETHSSFFQPQFFGVPFQILQPAVLWGLEFFLQNWEVNLFSKVGIFTENPPVQRWGPGGSGPMPTPPPGKEFDWQVMGERGPEQSTLARTWGKLQTTTYPDLCKCPLSLVQ